MTWRNSHANSISRLRQKKKVLTGHQSSRSVQTNEIGPFAEAIVFDALTPDRAVVPERRLNARAAELDRTA